MSVVKSKSVKGSLQAASYKGQEVKESVLVSTNQIVGETPGEIWQEMKDTAGLNKNVSKPFMEEVISPPAEYVKGWKDADWKKYADEYAQRRGYGGNQYTAYLHKNTDNPHLHLQVCRINDQGKCNISDWQSGPRSLKVVNEMSRERGWKNAQELAEEKNQGRRNALLQSVESSKDWQEVKQKMSDRGYHLEIAQSEGKGVYGLRIAELEELLRRERREKNATAEKEKNYQAARIKAGQEGIPTQSPEFKKLVRETGREKGLQKDSFISQKEKKFVKPGEKLSSIDRKIKIKDLEEQLKKNLEKSQNHSKSFNYGRRT